jgi:hypothetical protein
VTARGDALDRLRVAVSKTDALAHAAQEMFDGTVWGGAVDAQRLERMAQLIGATAEAAAAALNAVDVLNSDLLDPGTTGEPGGWG